MRILIAEDDPFLRRVYSEKLRSAGFQVETSENGEEALGKVKLGGFDLMLLDILMPGKDGFQVLEERQRDPALQRIRVVMLSCLDQEADVERAKSLGADDYFLKSTIDLDELIKKVSGMLPEKASQDRRALIPAFLTDARESILGIKKALDALKISAEDPKAQFEIMRLFHSLKSASGFMGYQPLSDTCLNIEKRFRGLLDSKVGDTAAAAEVEEAVNGIEGELGLIQ